MNINNVLGELDNLFASNRYAEVEDFLKAKYSEAMSENDIPSMITILNELMGYYREATNYEAALVCVKKSRDLMDSIGMQGTMQYAAMLLNEANAYRAAGYYDKAYECYEAVKPIYEKYIKEDDYMYATYYNNLSILFQATSQYEKAKECLCKARDIIITKPEAHIDVAVTYTNLAATLVKLNELDEAIENVKKAKAIFDEDEPKDYHYSACLDVLGEICFKKGDYKSAKKVYDLAVSEVEKTIGKNNKTYEMLLENRNEAEKLYEKMKNSDESSGQAGDQITGSDESSGQAGDEITSSDESAGQAGNQITSSDESVGQMDNEITSSDKVAIQTDGVATNRKKISEKSDSEMEDIKSLSLYDEIFKNCDEDSEKVNSKQINRQNMQKSNDKNDEKKQKSVIEICRLYYETYVKDMIHENFPDYETKITAGIAGEGSECFGFEDKISRDHDCSLGVCLWMDRDVYLQIGDEVAKIYDRLPDTFMGLKRQNTFYGKNRRGPIMTEQFYEYILGIDLSKESEADVNPEAEIINAEADVNPEAEINAEADVNANTNADVNSNLNSIMGFEWQNIEEWKLAAVTNGEIFFEAENRFTRIRKEILGYYDEKTWLKKLAECLAQVAATGQYNYGRMMARSEYVAADMAFAKYLEEICKLVNLINKRYSPYYKWIHRSIKDTKHLPEIYDLLRALTDIKNKKSQREAWADYDYRPGVNVADEISLTIEIIAKLVVEKLHELGITKGDDTYLQAQAEEILSFDI